MWLRAAPDEREGVDGGAAWRGDSSIDGEWTRDRCMAGRLAGGVAAVVGVCGCGSGRLFAGQTAPPQSVEDALHRMSDRAAVVFAGQVTAVRRVDGGEVGLGSGGG